MFACARSWACEQDDEFDGLGVHGLELHRGGWTTDREGGGGDAVALAVRDREAVPDSCGAGLLAGPDGVLEGLWVFDHVVVREQIDKLVDRGLLISRGQRCLDAVNSEDIREVHSFLPWIGSVIRIGYRRYYWRVCHGSSGGSLISVF